MFEIVKFDRKVLLGLQKIRSPHWNRILKVITFTGTGRFWFLFSGTLIILNYQGIRFVDNQNTFMKVLIAPFIGFLIGRIFKHTVRRKRPSQEIPGFVELVKPPTCGSFPSNHTASTFAFFIGLVLIGHPLAFVAGLWAVTVAFSRLYLGVHYFSDVIGGILVGAVSPFVVRYLYSAFL